MAVATTTIVLYRESNKTIIAEVYEGEQYFIPDDVMIFSGTLGDFLSINPDYKHLENLNQTI